MEANPHISKSQIPLFKIQSISNRFDIKITSKSHQFTDRDKQSRAAFSIIIVYDEETKSRFNESFRRIILLPFCVCLLFRFRSAAQHTHKKKPESCRFSFQGMACAGRTVSVITTETTRCCSSQASKRTNRSNVRITFSFFF